LTNSVSAHLDGDDFASALISGIHRVYEEQETLNQINVFPVADGDTGTNMALTMGATMGILNASGEKHLGTLLAAIADVLLDNSRGNSGAIIAQFFQGLSDSAGELTRFTTVTLAKAATTGSKYAHDALSDPREGTILSVISAFADSVNQQAETTSEAGFARVFENALPQVGAALKKTTEQLDVLRRAGVVDAGAKGFVALIEGMAEFIINGRVVEKPNIKGFVATQAAQTTAGSNESSEFRYCTECVVTGADIDRRKLRESLSALGNSLVLAGTKRKGKIHIHANDPDGVFLVARKFGTVGAEKADDMHQQLQSSHDQTSQFAVICDSAADVADEDMDRLDIHMVPCRIQFGDRGYLDKVSITAEEFYAELDSNTCYPTTSQPSPGDYRRQLQFLVSHFSDVLLLSVTARASGALHAARSAAERIEGPGRVHVIDSRSASTGQGLLTIFAAECAQAGLNAEETISAIKILIPKTHTYALVRNLSHAVRGGRVPKYLQTIASVLRLQPVIRTIADGRVATAGFLFGMHNRLQKFSRFVCRRTESEGLLRVAIGHALCAEDAAEFARYLRASLPNIHTLTITDLGAALGAHGGPGTIIIATQPYVAPGEVVAGQPGSNSVADGD
jgi:DegV family protein with EDD domain